MRKGCMLGQKNILILTSETGGGHISLAEALRDLLTDAAEASVSGARALAITITDPQPRAIHLHYRLVSRHALGLWAAEYRMFDTPLRARLAQRAFAPLARRQLYALLGAVRPDLIISTYPFFSYALIETLRRHGISAPLALLLSDASRVHSTWLAERRVAAALAPTHETYQQALAAGFSPNQLHLSGWPVRQQFLCAAQMSQAERAGILTALNLDPNRFTVFLQGGGEGAAYVERAIESVRRARGASGGAQVILAAGSNQGLLARYGGTRHLAALPFTPNIAPFMAAADVIMGKAGPNTLLEAVMLGKPFIATTYIPGQEHTNLAFIQKYGLGWVALTAERLHALLERLMSGDGALSVMSATVSAYRQWNLDATARIAPVLDALLTPSASSRAL